MKKYISMVFLLLCVTFGNAQNFQFIPSNFDSYYFSPQNLGFASPQTTDFAKYGNVEINHYHGLLDLEIPLNGYKDRDFNIPMSLKYVSEGFKPYKRPSVVGYSWLLNIGGVITREVKNSPDDIKGRYTENALEYMPDGLLAAIRNRKFKYYNETTLSRFEMEKTKEKNSFPTNDFSHDYEPDIFNFSFGDHIGSFIIGNMGTPASLSGDGYKININKLFVQDFSTTNPPQASEIEITTPDGYKYIFGGSENFLEYSIPNNPQGIKKKPVTISSWFLKRIEAPNKRVVNFAYQKVLQPTNYKYYVANSTSKRTTSTSFEGGSSSNNISWSDSKEYAIEDKIHLPLLSSITIDNIQYEFIYELFSWNFFGSDNAYDVYYLKGMATKYNSDIRNTVSYTYIVKEKFFFLESVREDDKQYNFDYYLDRRLPDPQTNSIDHWGFWNGNYSTTEDSKTYLSNIDVRKAVNISVFNTGLLKRIIYPTKGITEIEYEPNKYNHRKEKDLDVFHYYDVLSSEEILCGGARVRNIRDYDPISQKTFSLRTFSYCDPQTNRGSGVVELIPKYVSSEEIRTHWTSSETVWDSGVSTTIYYRNDGFYYNHTRSSNTLSSEKNLSEYHIGYSDVIETFTDGSCIHYHYSSYKDVPDNELVDRKFNEHNEYLGEFVNYRSLVKAAAGDKYGLYKMNDMSRFRGKLLSKTTYSSDRIPVLTETFKYNINDAISKTHFSITSLPRGMVLNRIYTIPCRMIEHRSINSENVLQVLSYAYNDINLVSELKTTNSNTSEYAVSYKYPSDYLTSTDENIKELIKKNMLSNPLSIIKTIRKNGSNESFVLDGIKFDYQIVHELPVIKNLKRLNILTPLNAKFLDLNSDNHFEIRESYTQYDDYGNPNHVIKDLTRTTTYLWGYEGQHLIAEIKNLPFGNVFSKFGYDLGYISQMSNPDVEKIRSILDKGNFYGTHVFTHSHLPLAGMLQTTDPKGQSTYYTYDKYGRLKYVKDNNQNYLNAYNYHYKDNSISNDTLASLPIQVYNNPLSFNFILPPTTRYNKVGEPCYRKGQPLELSFQGNGGSGNFLCRFYLDDKSYKSKGDPLFTKITTLGKKTIYPRLFDLETGESIQVKKTFDIELQGIGFSNAKYMDNGRYGEAEISCFESTDITFLMILESKSPREEFQFIIGDYGDAYVDAYGDPYERSFFTINNPTTLNQTYIRITESFPEGTTKVKMISPNIKQSRMDIYIESASNGIVEGINHVGVNTY